MEITTLPVGPLRTNCYLLKQDQHCIIIDPGAEVKKILHAIDKNKLLAILLTHTHSDHTGAIEEIQKITKAPLFLSDKEYEFLKSGKGGALHEFTFQDEQLFKHEEKIKIGSFECETIVTPGHTAGSSCFLFKKNSTESQDILFTGDTLFHNAIGRMDLPGGSEKAMRTSLEYLKKLPAKTVVYPGHGFVTTIEAEI